MKFKSDISQTIYETAEGMFKVGVMDAKTFQEITKDCFVKERVKPLRVKREVSPMLLEAVM